MSTLKNETIPFGPKRVKPVKGSANGKAIADFAQWIKLVGGATKEQIACFMQSPIQSRTVRYVIEELRKKEMLQRVRLFFGGKCCASYFTTIRDANCNPSNESLIKRTQLFLDLAIAYPGIKIVAAPTKTTDRIRNQCPISDFELNLSLGTLKGIVLNFVFLLNDGLDYSGFTGQELRDYFEEFFQSPGTYIFILESNCPNLLLKLNKTLWELTRVHCLQAKGHLLDTSLYSEVLQLSDNRINELLSEHKQSDLRPVFNPLNICLYHKIWFADSKRLFGSPVDARAIALEDCQAFLNALRLYPNWKIGNLRRAS